MKQTKKTTTKPKKMKSPDAEHGGYRDGAGRKLDSLDQTIRQKRQIRFSDAEWEAVWIAAERANLTVSDYVRMRTVDPKILREVIAA